MNRNLIPYDSRTPLETSGIRVGTPAVTFRGFGQSEIDELGSIMLTVLGSPDDETVRAEARERVAGLCTAFPIYT